MVGVGLLMVLTGLGKPVAALASAALRQRLDAALLNLILNAVEARGSVEERAAIVVSHHRAKGRKRPHRSSRFGRTRHRRGTSPAGF